MAESGNLLIEPSDALIEALRQPSAQTVPAAVLAAADDIAGHFAGAVLGVLFYGSCLRTGEVEDKVLDFYVLVDAYENAYEKAWMAKANALIPPNVFYAETDHKGITVRSKYAVLSLDDFVARARPDTLNVSIWARFCQPTVLLLSRSDDVCDRVYGALRDAVLTMLGAALTDAGAGADSATLWSTAFTLTYGAELRSEPVGKGLEIYQLDRNFYDRLTAPALSALDVPREADSNGGVRILDAADKATVRANRRLWRKRRINGKFVSFARLVKASFTFDGGIDYLAWKISRHSGVQIEVKPWHRRHPVIAGLTLFISLRLKGAFR